MCEADPLADESQAALWLLTSIMIQSGWHSGQVSEKRGRTAIVADHFVITEVIKWGSRTYTAAWRATGNQAVETDGA